MRLPGKVAREFETLRKVDGESVFWLASPLQTSVKDYDRFLSTRAGKATTVVFSRVDQKDAKSETFDPTEFERYLRLSRNHGFWMATPSQVRRYAESRAAVRLESESLGNTRVIRADIRKPLSDPHPLTIIYHSSSTKVRVSNSMTDGIHEVRNGIIMFDMMPGSQVIIENL
jgi:hypothetical protein